jgi:hypothetical protein
MRLVLPSQSCRRSHLHVRFVNESALLVLEGFSHGGSIEFIVAPFKVLIKFLRDTYGLTEPDEDGGCTLPGEVGHD